MRVSSLKSSSFVSYFSHLPPDQAIEKCAQLQGASDICSNVDNWKAYVAKRYGLKYSLQRPDLLTADEWMAQAMELEKVKSDISVTTNRYRTAVKNDYTAIAYRDNPPYVINLFRLL
jgi:hypothetical protein